MVGGLLLGAGAVAALRDPYPFFQSYLFGFVFCAAPALGCLGLLILHQLTGGAWGRALRPVALPAALTLPWLAAIFVPLLAGLTRLYPWAQQGLLATDHVLQHKAAYLNVPFFIGRSVLYFSLWCFFAQRLRRGSVSQGVAGGALLVYVLTISFSSIDWLMSLDPHWASSIYGVLLLVGYGLNAFAFTITMLWRRRADVDPDTTHDLGNLLFAFVLLWAYMAFSQYLIIWAGNLPEEITWYIARRRGGWQYVGLALVGLQFALPFFMLLARRRKRSLRALAPVAIGILVMRFVDTAWLTMPSFNPGHLTLHWMNVVVPAGLVCVWMGLYDANCDDSPVKH
jgi:hypothetical protein